MPAHDLTSPRGYLIAIDNIASDDTRPIIEKVTNILRRSCQLHLQTYFNLSCKAMKHLFVSLSRSDHSKLHCLFVVVLSRGKKVRGVYDTNKKLLPLEHVCSYFSNANCPSLKGKPKLFLFETVVDSSETILNCESLCYPSVEDCFVTLSTIMETASVSCISKFADILCSQTRNFSEVICEFKLMHRNFRVGQIIIETNTFPVKPLFFHVSRLNQNLQ